MIMDLLIKKAFPALLLYACLAGCTKEEKGLTPQQVRQMADSIYRVKAQKIRKQAAEDLDRRMSIELKPKIDSLLGRTATAAPPPLMNTDTAYEIPVPDSTDVPDGDTITEKRR